MIPLKTSLEIAKKCDYMIPAKVINDCTLFLNSFSFYDDIKLVPLPSGGILLHTSDNERIEIHANQIIVYFDDYTDAVYNSVASLIREYVPPCMTL